MVESLGNIWLGKFELIHNIILAESRLSVSLEDSISALEMNMKGQQFDLYDKTFNEIYSQQNHSQFAIKDIKVEIFSFFF